MQRRSRLCVAPCFWNLADYEGGRSRVEGHQAVDKRSKVITSEGNHFDDLVGHFDAAEAKAEVKKMRGRGAYGVRRTFVDAGKALKISREGLTALGGWSDPQMADRIYADEEQRYARQEARDVRARIRGEASIESGENDRNNQ